MKSFLLIVQLLISNFYSNSLQDKRFDVLGYLDYRWGTPIQKIVDDLKAQQTEYELSSDQRWPHQRDIKIHTGIQLDETRGLPWLVEKTFVFYRDSLIKVVLIKRESLSDERDKIYNAFKRILAEKYGSNFQDTVLHKGKPTEGPYCAWKFPSTTISLTNEGTYYDYVRILYELTGIDERMNLETKQKSKTEF